MTTGDHLSNKNIFDGLKSYWFIIAFIGAVIIGWVRIESTVAEHEQRLDKVEAQQVIAQNTFNQMALDIQEIKTTLSFIKERLEK